MFSLGGQIWSMIGAVGQVQQSKWGLIDKKEQKKTQDSTCAVHERPKLDWHLLPILIGLKVHPTSVGSSRTLFCIVRISVSDLKLQRFRGPRIARKSTLMRSLVSQRTDLLLRSPQKGVNHFYQDSYLAFWPLFRTSCYIWDHKEQLVKFLWKATFCRYLLIIDKYSDWVRILGLILIFLRFF